MDQPDVDLGSGSADMLTVDRRLGATLLLVLLVLDTPDVVAVSNGVVVVVEAVLVCRNVSRSAACRASSASTACRASASFAFLFDCSRSFVSVDHASVRLESD